MRGDGYKPHIYRADGVWMIRVWGWRPEPMSSFEEALGAAKWIWGSRV